MTPTGLPRELRHIRVLLLKASIVAFTDSSVLSACRNARKQATAALPFRFFLGAAGERNDRTQMAIMNMAATLFVDIQNLLDNVNDTRVMLTSKNYPVNSLIQEFNRGLRCHLYEISLKQRGFRSHGLAGYQQQDGSVPISEETRRKVINAIKEQNYKPNYAAKRLRSKELERSIGLYVPWGWGWEIGGFLPFRKGY